MENIKQINIKNGTCNFFNDMINIKDLNSSLPKILVFTILGTLQSKKLMIIKIFIVQILCIWWLVKWLDISKKTMEINT